MAGFLTVFTDLALATLALDGFHFEVFAHLRGTQLQCRAKLCIPHKAEPRQRRRTFGLVAQVVSVISLPKFRKRENGIVYLTYIVFFQQKTNPQKTQKRSVCFKPPSDFFAFIPCFKLKASRLAAALISLDLASAPAEMLAMCAWFSDCNTEMCCTTRWTCGWVDPLQ